MSGVILLSLWICVGILMGLSRDDYMASSLELRDWQKRHLSSLLRIKRADGQTPTNQSEIEYAVVAMEPEDVAYCEKIIGVTAI